MRNTYSKNIRYFSMLVLLVFIIGTLASLSILPSFALSPFEDAAYLLETEDRIALYLDKENAFATKEDKLATMSERITVGDYTIYVETTTGEVAVKHNKTGQILMTNPYDVASAPEGVSVSVKEELMSQVMLTFCNIQTNGEATFGSFKESAKRGQITVKNIRNGIRVEYTLGKESSKQLVPGWAEATRFLDKIAYPMLENIYTEEDHEAYIAENEGLNIELESFESRRNRKMNLFMSNYDVINLNDPDKDKVTYNSQAKTYACCTETVAIDYAAYLVDKDFAKDFGADRAEILNQRFNLPEKASDYKMIIFAINPKMSERLRNSIESSVKQYTNYSYEDLQIDTMQTGYPGEDSNPALFRMALEYTLNKDGLEVRLPANSVRFNEDMYRLISIEVLPYFGTSSNDFNGYTFIPDGSGTIIRNEDIMNADRNGATMVGKVYGTDFSYHNIPLQYGRDETMHLPVFGAIEDTITVTDNRDNQIGYIWKETVKTSDGKPVYFTDKNEIMVDAVDSNGNLITTLEDFLAQFKVNAAGDVIRIGDKRWDSPDFNITIEVADGDDPLANYKVYEEQKKVPHIELIEFYLMAPVLGEDGQPLTYQDEQKVVHTVYQYVDAEGNPVDVENRVAGVLKVREQLWYNGQPAFYQTGVPKNGAGIFTGSSEAPVETTATGTGEGEGEGETPETTVPDTTAAAPVTTAAPTGSDAPETTDEVELYDDIPAVDYQYDFTAYEQIETVVSEGYFAVITEGDALCNITTEHGGMNPTTGKGGPHKYNSVYITVFPRPQDSYRLADAISVSNDAAEWVVVSDRKYTGSYRIQYTFLSDAVYEEEGKFKTYEYEASYVGMANAYRDYLIANGILTELDASDVDDDIPLYLETFGMTTATKVVATIPMVMDVALTTFDDLKAIYKDLGDKGIDNVNFRLTGFTKGGLYSYAPSAAKFESVVGGNGDYEDMVKYCQEISAQDGKHLNIFPDFDFANVERTGGFDGFDSLKDAARTIDGRYASKRAFSSTYQSFSPVGSITVSPSVYVRLFDSFAKKIDKLGVSGLSVGSLGTDLNSDFDEDDAYNREDSKYYTVELLKELDEKYGNIMIEGGNAFALQYADYIVDMPLDSSRRSFASASIPFMGMVLHGYINYAGAVTGMASDIDREMLKIIENGAAPYFTVAYQNTAVLKEEGTQFSDYYSVDYKICFDQIVETYNELNKHLADLQTAKITDHVFLDGIRSLGANEQAEVDALMAAAEADYASFRAAAVKAYNNRKALAERRGEEFTEIFEETYPYFTSETDSKEYVQFVYDEYCATLDRAITGSEIVLVEYTRKDGSTKSFILNYTAYTVTVTLNNGSVYEVPANGFAVAGK